MADSGFSIRDGLWLRAAGGDLACDLDLNQAVDESIATARVLIERWGGPGILAGGASHLADLAADGTAYPPVTLLLLDDADRPHLRRTVAARAIIFLISDGAASLFAVVEQQAGVSPAAAKGGLTSVVFLAQPAGEPAPAHALHLGAGTVTSEQFTSWSEVAGARVETLRVGTGHGAAGLELLTGAGQRGRLTVGELTDERTYLLPDHSGQVALLAGPQAFGGLVSVGNGQFAMSRAAACGPPVTGSYVAGQWWHDGLGASWFCSAGGTPGTWVQMTAGVAASAPTASDFAGATVLAGYRYHDTSDGQEWSSWQVGGSHLRWQSATTVTVPLGRERAYTNTGNIPVSASGQSPFRSFWPDEHDLRLVRAKFGIEIGGGADAANHWTVRLQKWVPSPLALLAETTVQTTSYTVWEVVPSGSDGLIEVGSYRFYNVQIESTDAGSLGPLNLETPTISYRWVK